MISKAKDLIGCCRLLVYLKVCILLAYSLLCHLISSQMDVVLVKMVCSQGLSECLDKLEVVSRPHCFLWKEKIAKMTELSGTQEKRTVCVCMLVFVIQNSKFSPWKICNTFKNCATDPLTKRQRESIRQRQRLCPKLKAAAMYLYKGSTFQNTKRHI